MSIKLRAQAGCLVLLLFSYLPSKSQRYIWSPDSISLEDPNYAMERYHDILRYHDPLMYLAFPVVSPVVQRRVPLKDGEGKNGYWAEGQFGYRFVIMQGKYHNYSFLQRNRLTFDVSLLPRLTRDDSSPILPLNTKFGIGWDFLLSGLRGLEKERVGLLWSTVQFHHYSNGQADSFFIDDPVQRNNYLSGDFSTNYVKLLLNIGSSSQQKNILTASMGYQKEVDLKGPLARSKELTNYYGDSRLLFQIQFVKKPKLVTSNVINRVRTGIDTINVEKRRQVSFRIELEYILGDLSTFRGNNKWRLGWHNYLTFMPSVTNEVGFLAHTFLGRDYLNVRFDDVVFIGELGVYVKFNSR
jgi:hypothetical protein